MAEVTVREATKDDVVEVAASSAALFAEDAAQRDQLRNQGWPRAFGEQWCADLITDDNALVMVAVAGDVCVGHLVATFSHASDMWLGSKAELLSMFVRPSHRSDGAGSRLVDGFVAWATERGAARLQVDAYAANVGALRFYERQGFVPHSIQLVQDL